MNQSLIGGSTLLGLAFEMFHTCSISSPLFLCFLYKYVISYFPDHATMCSMPITKSFI